MPPPTTTTLRYAGFIHPTQLLEQVATTVPWLAPPAQPDAPPLGSEAFLAAAASGPLGYQEVLALAFQEGGQAARWVRPESPPPQGRSSYFALCLAAHFATVASFCPTDVDTKIRVHVWAPSTVDEALEGQLRSLQAALAWDSRPVSTRWAAPEGHEPVAGHHGELLSVVMGAAGGLLHRGRVAEATALVDWAEDELRREAKAFQAAMKPGQELLALQLASILAHNAGDVDQGQQGWPEAAEAQALKGRVGRLCHEGSSPLAQSYQAAKSLYQLIAAEGHRHYPLRSVKCLRRSPELLLPIGPCFDAWGGVLAQSQVLSEEDRMEVLGALILGGKKVPGQDGYARAVAGFLAAKDQGIEHYLRELPPASRPLAKDPAFKRAIGLARHAFESSLRKKARLTLDACATLKKL